MIYPFIVDDVAYEADVTVTPGHPGTPATMGDPGDPPEGDEIEIDALWLVINRKRITEIERTSDEYADLEKYLLDHGQFILDMHALEMLAADAEEGDARNDREREG